MITSSKNNSNIGRVTTLITIILSHTVNLAKFLKRQSWVLFQTLVVIYQRYSYSYLTEQETEAQKIGTEGQFLTCLAAQTSPTLRPCGLRPTRLLCPWDFPGKNTGVGCHSLLQRIFLTQGSNTGLLNCRWILYHLSRQGSPSPRDRQFVNSVRGALWI